MRLGRKATAFVVVTYLTGCGGAGAERSPTPGQAPIVEGNVAAALPSGAPAAPYPETPSTRRAVDRGDCASNQRSFPQRTVQLALDSFVRAHAAKRYDVLLCFVPRSKAANLSLTEAELKGAWEGAQKETIDSIVAGIVQVQYSEEPLSEVISTQVAAGQHWVRLVREEGLWKIEDME
jgi:hypothetical protein